MSIVGPPGLKGQTHGAMHKCSSCFKFPVWVDRLSFVLLVPLHSGTYLCTCAHLDTNTHRQAHKGWGMGSSEKRFKEPSFLLTPLTPKAIFLSIYVVVREGWHLICVSVEWSWLLCNGGCVTNQNTVHLIQTHQPKYLSSINNSGWINWV